MIKGYQAELMDMYEKTRTEENRKLAKRREEIKNKYRADVIAVAHHQDDSIETMLLNLIRGCIKRNY